MSELVIRKASRADSAAIFQILHEHEGDDLAVGNPRWTLAQVEETICDSSEDPAGGSCGLVLSDETGVLAFILFRVVPGAREILHLATALRARRRGYMQRLLLELIRAKGADEEIWLEVHEVNENARVLYEKLQFRPVGRRPQYYADGGAAILYNLR